MNRRALGLLALPALLGLQLLAGCTDASAPSGPTSTKLIPLTSDYDVLFVIQNSSNIEDKLTVFAASFPKFVAALDAFPTGRPNLHIGVVDTTIDLGTPLYTQVGCPSPDPGDNGALQSSARVPGCAPPTGAFLSDVAGSSGRTVNYMGTLDAALACIAQVGGSGCGFVTPLEAMKRALDGSNPNNAGFLRPDAFLAVIFIGDQDDVSAKDSAVYALPDVMTGGPEDPVFAYQCDQPISPTAAGTYSDCKPRTDTYMEDPEVYAQFLTSVKDPARLVVAMIAAPPPGLATDDIPTLAANEQEITIGPLGTGDELAVGPSCTATINGTPTTGIPAIRLASFLGHFGSRGRFYSVCQSDYSAALADIGKTMFNAMSPCLEGDIVATDTDAHDPGTQLACTVSDVAGGDSATATRTAIPACPMIDATSPSPDAPLPCWYTVISATDCPLPDTGFELKIDRGGATVPPGDVVSVECPVGS